MAAIVVGERTVEVRTLFAAILAGRSRRRAVKAIDTEVLLVLHESGCAQTLAHSAVCVRAFVVRVQLDTAERVPKRLLVPSLPMSARNVSRKEPRSRVLPPLRVSEAEREGISLRAAEAGLSVSEFLRRAALNGAIVPRRPLADAQLMLALAQVGNNLNQIARHCHAHGLADPELLEELYFAVDRHGALMDALTHAAEH